MGKRNTKAKNSRRRVAAQGQQVVRNPGSRRTHTVRTVSEDIELQLARASVNVVKFSLTDVLGTTQAASVLEWFDEYRLDRATLVAVGHDIKTNIGIPTVVSCADTDTTHPTNYNELLNMAGARVQPMSFNMGTILLGSCKPKFDVNGDNTQFRNGWISCDSITAKWNGFVLSTTSPEAFTVDCILKVRVSFRGFQ